MMKNILFFGFSLFINILIVFIVLCNCEETKSGLPNLVGHGKVGHYPINSEACGRHYTDLTRKRIRDGDPAEQGDFPWNAAMMSFVRPNPSVEPKPMLKCGASLISDYWVITAKHCFNGFIPNTKIEFYFGSILTYDSLRKYEMAFVSTHAEFDVALVRLKTRVSPLIINNKYQINTICLPTANIININREKAVFAGFGAVNVKGDNQTTILRTAIYNIEPLEVCKRKYQIYQFKDESICVETIKQMNCYGDSGSGLVQLDGKQAVLIGLASRHGPNPDICDKGWIEFVRVSMFVDWIRRIVENDPKVDYFPTTRAPRGPDNTDYPTEKDSDDGDNDSHNLSTEPILLGIQICFIIIFNIFD